MRSDYTGKLKNGVRGKFYIEEPDYEETTIEELAKARKEFLKDSDDVYYADLPTIEPSEG